jgi:hypothetical protein
LEQPLPKAGILAVRMAPVLSRSLLAALGLAGRADYVSERRYLAPMVGLSGRGALDRCRDAGSGVGRTASIANSCGASLSSMRQLGRHTPRRLFKRASRDAVK